MLPKAKQKIEVITSKFLLPNSLAILEFYPRPNFSFSSSTNIKVSPLLANKTIVTMYYLVQ